MKPRNLEKMLHSDGKLHVRYVGPSGSLTVEGMLFKHGVEQRLAPSKADLLAEFNWNVLEVLKPTKGSKNV